LSASQERAVDAEQSACRAGNLEDSTVAEREKVRGDKAEAACVGVAGVEDALAAAVDVGVQAQHGLYAIVPALKVAALFVALGHLHRGENQAYLARPAWVGGIAMRNLHRRDHGFMRLWLSSKIHGHKTLDFWTESEHFFTKF